MEDREIIDLYFRRDEQAIRETMNKYEGYCYRIALNILQDHEDVKECLNDTWNSVWQKIPPLRPVSLKAFLVKLIRSRAISRYRYTHAARRCSGGEILLSELEECIPDHADVEQTVESRELSRLISDWLRSRSREEQVLFVRRYYHGENVKKLASEFQYSENALSQKMSRLRRDLKKYLGGYPEK